MADERVALLFEFMGQDKGLGRSVSTLKDGLGTVESKVGGIGKSVDGLVGKFRWAAPLIEGLMVGAAVNSAGAFDKELGKIGIMLDQTMGELRTNYGSMLKDMGHETLNSGKMMAQGFYEIKSRFTELGEAEIPNVLDPAAKAAKASGAEIVDVVGALSKLYEGYRFEVTETERVTDKLFATEKAGATKVRELASSIGGVATVASAAGVSMDELLGSVAVLSKPFGTEGAVTDIRQMLQTMARPTDEAQKIAQEIGVDFSWKGMEKAGGIQPFMEDLGKKLEGKEELLPKLFTDMQGMLAAQVLTGADANKELGRAIKAIGESAGATDKAYEVATDNLIDQLGGLRDSVGRLGEAIAGPWMDILQTIVEGISNLFDRVAGFAEEHPTAAGAVGVLGGAYVGGKVLGGAVNMGRRVLGGGGIGLGLGDVAGGALLGREAVRGGRGLGGRALSWMRGLRGGGGAAAGGGAELGTLAEDYAARRGEELAARQADDVARMTKRAADKALRRRGLEDLGTRMTRELAEEGAGGVGRRGIGQAVRGLGQRVTGSRVGQAASQAGEWAAGRQIAGRTLGTLARGALKVAGPIGIAYEVGKTTAWAYEQIHGMISEDLERIRSQGMGMRGASGTFGTRMDFLRQNQLTTANVGGVSDEQLQNTLVRAQNLVGSLEERAATRDWESGYKVAGAAGTLNVSKGDLALMQGQLAAAMQEMAKRERRGATSAADTETRNAEARASWQEQLAVKAARDEAMFGPKGGAYDRGIGGAAYPGGLEAQQAEAAQVKPEPEQAVVSGQIEHLLTVKESPAGNFLKAMIETNPDARKAIEELVILSIKDMRNNLFAGYGG